MKNTKYFRTLDEYIKTVKDTSKEQFLLVSENCEFDINKLLKTGLKFYGAIVTQVIFDEKNCDKGLVVTELNDGSSALLVKDLESFNLKKENFTEIDSVTVVLDGLSKHITTFLESLFHVLPSNTEIIGGGAGKLTLKQEPVIFSNEGIFQNSAIIITTQTKLTVGVENGWEYLEGPFMVTSSEKNVLKSLNFMEAFETYKNIVEKDSGLTFNNDNFFDIAKAYPFGVIKFNDEIVVRDPIAKDEHGNLILVGDLEQNSTINILKGNKESLISSSGNAIVTALKNSNNNFENVMLFDCISRCIFLEDDFKKELHEIKKHIPEKKLFGALTLGEIANNGNEYINFYNKTCVVGVLC